MPKYSAETLTVEDVRLWYRLHGTMYSPEIALHSSYELREHLRGALPEYPEPSDAQKLNARSIVAADLNEHDGVDHA